MPGVSSSRTPADWGERPVSLCFRKHNDVARLGLRRRSSRTSNRVPGPDLFACELGNVQVLYYFDSRHVFGVLAVPFAPTPTGAYRATGHRVTPLRVWNEYVVIHTACTVPVRQGRGALISQPSGHTQKAGGRVGVDGGRSPHRHHQKVRETPHLPADLAQQQILCSAPVDARTSGRGCSRANSSGGCASLPEGKESWLFFKISKLIEWSPPC